MTLKLDKSSWPRVALGDVVRNVNETVRDAEAARIGRVIAMEHLDPSQLRVTRWGSVVEGTTFTRRVRPGQTLFGKRRAYQRKVAYAEFDAICSGDILTFDADGARVLPEFLPFLCQSDKFFAHALGTSAGSLSPRTNWRDLSSFEFDLPTLDEQRRLANLLWGVERHRMSIGALLDSTVGARSELINTFVQGVPGKRIRLGDSLDIVRGGSPRPINDYFTEEEDGLHWIKIGDVPPDGKYIDATSQRIKPSGLDRTRAVKPGDLLLSNSMSFGRPYIVRIDGCIHDGWLALSDRNGEWRTEYLYYLLRSEELQDQFRQGAGGSTVKNLNIEIVKQVGVTLPVLADQDSLLVQMENVGTAATQLEGQLKALTALRTSLLDVFFGGVDGEVQ
jgi:type I restriction enzyme S subunit